MPLINFFINLWQLYRGNASWHLHKYLQYILSTVTPSIILPHLPSSFLRTISTGFIGLFSYTFTKYIEHICPSSSIFKTIILIVMRTSGLWVWFQDYSWTVVAMSPLENSSWRWADTREWRLVTLHTLAPPAEVCLIPNTSLEELLYACIYDLWIMSPTVITEDNPGSFY